MPNIKPIKIRKKKSPAVLALDLLIIAMAVTGLYLVLKPIVLHWQQDRLTQQLLNAYEDGDSTIEIDPNAYKVEGEEIEYIEAYETYPTEPTATTTVPVTSETGETTETGPTSELTLPSKPGGTTNATEATTTEATTAEPTPTPKPLVRVKAIARIKIDKISVDMPIAEGSSLVNLRVAIGHHSPTAPIGQPGLAVLFGHRSYTFGRHFNRLGEVAVDETFVIEDKTNRYTYQIRKIYRVLPEELLAEIYQPVEGSWVILVTCDPVRVASHRLLVLAEVIATEPIG